MKFLKLLQMTCLVGLMGCQASAPKSEFITVENQQFLKNGKPYYFIGTNFWYGPELGMQGEEGNRKRLVTELDSLHALHLDNLRILVGAEPGSKNVTSVHPYVINKDGSLNEKVLDGLDFMLAEMAKRDMVGVLYLTNSWDWSGGYGYYLREAGYGDSPDAAAKDGWGKYCDYAAHMNSDSTAQALYWKHVERILTHENPYTHRAYIDEPAIMAWQICNEPRPFLKKEHENMATFMQKTAALIKQYDKQHLISIGSEGTIGCAYDTALCKQIHEDKNVDYMTIHIWPKNWQWCSNERLTEDLPQVYKMSEDYLAENLKIAQLINKPVVIEEFGYPRDSVSYTPGTPTSARNAFYNFIFTKVVESAKTNGPIAGCNFWGWGGTARPTHERWQVGDPMVCDPPHEPQGWYSVFDNDTAMLQLIRKNQNLLNQ